MSKGLKSYLYNDTYSVDNAGNAYVVANKSEGDVILEIPLLKGFVNDYIDIFGYFSYSQRARANGLLGKGSGISLIRRIKSYPNAENYFVIEDEFGNDIKYEIPRDQIDSNSDIYRNFERKEYVITDYDGTYLYNNNGSYIFYPYGEFKPRGISLNYNNYISISYNDDYSTNELDYTISTSGNIINMTYTTNPSNGSCQATITLDSNNFINNVSIMAYNDDLVIKEICNNTYNIIEGSYIEVIDNITNKRLKINLSGNNATSVYEAYNSNYTDKVVNTYYYNPSYNYCYITHPFESFDVYYNENNRLEYIKSNDKIQYYKFIEGEFNWLKSLSNVIVPNYQNSIKNQNLVNNGFFVSDCNGWTTNNSNVSRFIDNQAPNGKFMYIQHNNVNNDAYITQTINKSGKNGDLFTFGCWYMCDFCQEEVKSGKVKIEFINNNSVVQTIYKDLWSTLEDRGLWLYILELIKVNYDYTNIRISFYSYNPNSCLSISGVELYGFLNGTIYEYDNYGNIIEIHNPRNNVKYKISMNDKRKYLIDQIIRDESDIISIEYDNKGNVKNKKHIGNFIEEYQYDNVSNLTKYTKSNGLYNMEISNKYIGRKLTESVNELGLKTTYDIDNRLGNIKSVTDAAGNKIKYLYTDNVLFGGFEYYNNQNILLDKTIVSRNTNKITNKVNNLGSEYEYDIDSKNRVLRVKSSILNSSNNKNIEEYTYLTKNNTTYDLLSQLKTINGDSYLYSYDNYGNITKIELKKNNSDILLKLCEYVYDELDRVIQIKEYKINDDALGTTLNNTINYEFNKYGDLSKVTDTLNNIEEYIYDDYGSILYINETVNNQTVTRQINNQLSNPNDFYNYMKYQDVDICYSSFFNEKVTIDGEERYSAHLSYISGHEFSNGDYLYINPNNDASSNINSEGLFNSCSLNKDFSLKYNLGVLNPINDIKFNVSFWFKAEEKDKYVRLLRLEKNNDTQNSFEIMINNNNQVELHNGAYLYDNHFLRSKTINENQWNFISITYWYEDYETTSYVTHYSLMVNDEILNYQVLNKAKIAGNTNLTIGYSDLSQLNFVGKITSLIVYKEAVTMNEKFIRDLYYTSKEYIIDSYEVVNEQAINQRVIKNMYVNETSYKPTNVLPLNNSFYTTSGKEPYINGMTSYQSLSKAKDFSYNQDIERFTYRANGKELVYDFNFKYDHSIYLQTYFNESSSNQYIFQNIDSNNKTMGLFRNTNKKLILEVNGVNYDTGYVISNETWNNLMFSYKSAIVASSSLSITVEHDFRIIVDGVVKYETTISNDFEYDWMKTYIGRAYDPLYPKPMYGQIEMVQTYNTYYTNSVAINICNSKKIISSVTKLNQFGLVCKENTANNIVCNSYQYLITDNTIKPLVNIQNINDNLNVIYNYDNYNENVLTKGLLTQYVVLKNLTIRTNTIYQYNDKNELISENDIANNKNIIYNYDNHGNIISKNVNGTITNFTYSTTYPDQLISVGNKILKYSSYNQRYPIEYGTYNGNTLISGYRYQWDGNKLIAVNKINYPYTSFKYDSNGKRIRKIHEQISEFIYKDYTYLGNKLTKEVINDEIRGDINTLYYLYDANNNLYGLKYNSAEYYYLRDNLNNVIGIIDSNKNIVCEYLYDAYGNHKVLNSNGVENTSYYFIGNLNPFRYRGYYYDVETTDLKSVF